MFDGGGKTFTIKHKTFYSYSKGNFAVSSITMENKWKKVKATNLSNVQYASVFNADTGERLILHVPDIGELDISSIKNIELRLQASRNENATSNVDWILF